MKYSDQTRRDINNLVTAAQRHDGTPDRHDLDLDQIEDIDEALDMYRQAAMHAQAAQAVKTATGAQLAVLLGEGGAACYGTNILRYRQGSKEVCIDPDGAAGYTATEIAAGRVRLDAVVNPTYMKRGWMSEAMRDTFYERVDEEAKLTDMPIGKAPKFLRDMTDGEIRIRRTT